MPAWPSVPDNYNSAVAELQELAAGVLAIRSDSLGTVKSRTKLAATATRLTALLDWLTTSYPAS